ncbi:ATP-binding protein [Actinobacillus lignieresii]|uniref:Type IV secretory pathway, VirB4 components n=1 Tax=Actinobacillus lignieresii TaxID=720 RepID=A0A380TXB3_ACTLI|nr:ATP-binding protein [Actinobacillus lignieresii]SUT92557.1 Type IV secretory pathway, VirB4 components [Actinobacillus lignieresii]
MGITIGENLSHSFAQSLSLTETKGANESKTSTETFGTNESKTSTETFGTNESKTNSTSFSTSSPTFSSKAGSILAAGIGAGIGFLLGGPVGAGFGANLGGTLGSAFNKSESESTSSSITTGTSYSKAEGTTRGSSYSKAEGATTGTSFSEGKTTGSTNTQTYGTSRNNSSTSTMGSSRQITLEAVDKSVEQLIKRVDHQLERVEEAKRYGGWQTAAYFMSEGSASSRALASIFLGLMRGNNSNSEDFALTTWQADKSKMLLPWLANLTHPRLMNENARSMGISYLTPATLVSGKEMAIQLNLPRRSTSTVSVVETESFGRRIQSVNGIAEVSDKTVKLGKIRHLWQETTQDVNLDIQKLSGHIFVTGSTGSSKSNTIYQLLNELNHNDVKFMVIEPAKGEYKNVFGYRDNVKVFGTNPKKTALLRINPFKFSEDVHVLEHIDRLIEIFNVCWPMYAAMPAVLKDAMLEAYQESGWDLTTSENKYPTLFPTFTDLLKQLETVLDRSVFSQEVKSNYQGSLVTRVKSLTNGLNGQIFTSDEIDNNLLFDENVVVDLSRVGSQETKSLIMGILVMRLSEYRMSSDNRMNQPLKHVTVLEEAHNILKRTSTEQSLESSNVAGKAVEMLSNAIAEMRTYGEGFIIADQSPSAVDISAIRNTNTKIIMRLPDEEDRRLAGRSAGVTDEQLAEIAKLPKGVAVVYQNDWLEPILCQVAHFLADEKLFVEPEQVKPNVDSQFKKHLADLLFKEKLAERKRLNYTEILQSIEKSYLPTDYKRYLNEVCDLSKEAVPALLAQDESYLIDLYERIIQQQFKDALPDLSVELQQHFSHLT